VRAHETEFQEAITETRVPGTGSLFEAIECLVKFANMVRKRRMNKAGRLSYVHIFKESSMQEGILNINLEDWPSRGDGKGENTVNGGGLNYGAVSFIKVNTGLLVETFGDKVSFVTINGAVSFVVEVEDPFATNNVHVRGWRNYSPGVVV
jgi:hypothetical protein